MRGGETIEIGGQPVDIDETKLNISGNHSLTELPESLGQLTNLKELIISNNNNLTKLPESLGGLTNLTHLIISRNYNLSSLPESLGQLTNLIKLVISNNNSLSVLPESLGSSTNLTNLTILDISNNNSLTKLPESLENLTNLTDLIISNNNSLTELPESLGQLTNLVISGNLSLTKLPENLRELAISNNNSLSELPESLENLTNLTHLIIYNNNSLTELPESLGQLTNLRELTISNNNSLTELPESLGQLTNLRELMISDNNSLTELPSLGQLTNLTMLDISNNNIDILPERIGRLTNIGDGIYELIEERERPTGVAYEIHNMFYDFDKEKYKKKLLEVLGEIEMSNDSLSVLICNYMNDLIYKLGKEREYRGNINKICEKLNLAEIGNELKELILLTFNLIDWLDSKKLKELYLDNFILTSMNAYNSGVDNMSCVKGIIERCILSLTELLKNENGICSNRLEDIDDLKDDKREYLLSLCDMYYGGLDQEKLKETLSGWLQEMSKEEHEEEYKQMNAEDRKNSCLDYIRENYTDNLEDNKRDLVEKQILEQLNDKEAYHWECDDIIELNMGCRAAEVSIKEGDEGGNRRKRMRKVKSRKILRRRGLQKISKKRIR